MLPYVLPFPFKQVWHLTKGVNSTHPGNCSSEMKSKLSQPLKAPSLIWEDVPCLKTNRGSSFNETCSGARQSHLMKLTDAQICAAVSHQAGCHLKPSSPSNPSRMVCVTPFHTALQKNAATAPQSLTFIPRSHLDGQAETEYWLVLCMPSHLPGTFLSIRKVVSATWTLQEKMQSLCVAFRQLGQWPFYIALCAMASDSCSNNRSESEMIGEKPLNNVWNLII